MNRLASLAAFSAFLAVALGAFGTHALRDHLSVASLQIWQTGVQYHLIHSLAAFATALVHLPKRAHRAPALFLIGVAIFSGSLYLLAITGVKVLGAITPVGGLAFLSAWLILAIGYGKPQED